MLDGILPAPRGVPQVEVAFDINANGILEVRAQDKGTGKEQKITITASSGLSKNEVEKMRKDAESHAADDARKKDEVETRNTADTLVYTAERTLREQGDKIPADLKQELEGKIAAVRSALQGTDTNYMRSATEDLSNVMQKIGSAVYGQAGAPPPPGGEPGSEAPGGPPPGGSEEGTVEGEFREV
jgi:molecular chaperone DnaK